MSNMNMINVTRNVYAGKVQLNDTVTPGTTCSPNGLVARDAAGAVLSCQSGVWKTSGTTITSYEQLPTGATAGYFVRTSSTSEGFCHEEVEPGYRVRYLFPHNTMVYTCGCRPGWREKLMGTSQAGDPLEYPIDVLARNSSNTYKHYTCIKL